MAKKSASDVAKRMELRKIMRTPQTLFESLQKTVIHQDDALRQLSTVAFYHKKSSTKRTGGTIKNMPLFLTGPTGSGKTHMVQTLCKALDLPHIVCNVMHLSASTYKGINLYNLGAQLLKSTENDKKVAATAIVFFDEFDKLFMDRQNTHMQSYHNLLISELLTVIEGSSGFPVNSEGDFIDSQGMLFILGGSFGMHKTDNKTSIGFHDSPTTDKKDIKDQLSLTTLGLPDELAGRIGGVIKMQKLTTDQLIDVFFDSPNSPINALERKLSLMDCQIQVEADLIKALIDDNTDLIEKFGVRGVYQAFQQLPAIGEILFHAPNKPKSRYVLGLDDYKTPNKEPTVAKYKRATTNDPQKIMELRCTWLDNVARLNKAASSIIQELQNPNRASFEELKLLAVRYESWALFYKECTTAHDYMKYVTKEELLMIDTSIKEQ